MDISTEEKNPFSPLPGFVSYHKSLSELFICDPLRTSGNKVNARTRHVITRSHANSITHLPCRYAPKNN